MFSIEGQVLDANPQLLKLAGYSYNKIVSLTTADLFDMISYDLLNRKIKNLLKGYKRKYPFECILVSNENKEKPVEVGLSLLENQYGFPKTVMTVIRDISRRKEAEKNLIQRAEELQKVFDAVPTILCVIDEQERLIKINRAGLISFEKLENQVIGKKIGDALECLYNDSAAQGCGFGEKCDECKIREGILRCLKNNEPVHDLETVIYKKDDRKFSACYQLNAVSLEAKGKIWGVISLKDITDRKRAEIETEHLHNNVSQANIELKKTLENLARSQSQLIESQKLQQIGLLATGLAHNLKTPLSGIKGYAQLLKFESPESNELTMIIEEVELIEKTINNLMLKSSKEHKNQEEVVDLNEVLRIGLSFLQVNLFFKHKITKKIDFDDNLPSLSGIYTHFSQSFMNIIQNSIDAMYETEKRELIIKTHHDDHFIYVDIKDTGCGIPDNIKESVFDSFFTTKPSSLDRKGDEPYGTGLGLSSSNYFIQQYGGEINILDSEEGGTIVSVKLPYNREVGNIAKRRVIIVDDSDGMVNILVQICQEIGMEALGCTKGIKAVELYKKIKPELLITDLSLPDLNGKDLSKKIRKINPSQKIVFITGYADDPKYSRWLSEQCNEPSLSSVLKKPFSLNRFKKVVQRIVFQD